MSLLLGLKAFEARIALRADDRDVSYDELADLAGQFAARLSEHRSLVFLEVEQDIESVAAYLGCVQAGHVVHLFSDYTDERLQALIEPYDPNYVIRHGDLFGEMLIARHHRPPALHPDLCLLLSTSGSTGAPKFVKLSHSNLESNAASIADYLGIGPADSVLLNLKLNYAYGLSILNSHLLAGARIVLSDASVTDDTFWQVLKAQKITSFPGVPYSFEIIARGDRLRDLPDLRYVTQAGGRLDAKLVKHFADLGVRQGWQFFVMYGQTEAAPRISYLPPEQAVKHAGCIGMAIPGGRLWLRDEAGQPVTRPDVPGELMYEGPNVMMGYAEQLSDLAHDETPSYLATGDVACFNEAGLFYIVGRLKRFVKPFGKRISLDDIQTDAEAFAPGAIVVGNDQRIIMVVDNPASYAALMQGLPDMARGYGLPESLLSVQQVQAIPRLANGKTDYQALNQFVLEKRRAMGAAQQLSLRDRASIVFSSAFLKQLEHEVLGLLGFKPSGDVSFRTLYAELFGKQVGEADSFRSLAGDSLSYVQVSLALEERIGFLPPDWETATITDLQNRYGDAETV
jgi:acyl-CoA synthetase (AMP-forming)/AMP-acid ligase II/acyl carrier protein